MSRRRRTTQLERTAYHEASHAVVATLLDVAVREVTIVPYVPEDDYAVKVLDARAGGGVKVSGCFVSLGQQLDVLLAGGVGENMFRRDYLIFSLFGSASSDMYRAEEAALCAFLGRAEEPHARAKRLLRKRRKSVRELLRENWNQVERVVQELLQHKTVSGDRVRELCTMERAA